MRKIPPGLRDEVNHLLYSFFEEGDLADFREAIRLLAVHCGVQEPKVVWRRPHKIDGGRAWARTGFTDQAVTIELVHPTRWKRLKDQPTDRHWVRCVNHEIGHWLDWHSAEERAEAFERWMMED